MPKQMTDVGSNPTSASNTLWRGSLVVKRSLFSFKVCWFLIDGAIPDVAHWIEHVPLKDDVAGSIPVI